MIYYKIYEKINFKIYNKKIYFMTYFSIHILNIIK